MSETLQFINCRILRKHKIIKEDLWVRNGIFINPEKVFFDEKVQADRKFDCNGCIISPGFIELQINGGSGIDFSQDVAHAEDGIQRVAKILLQHGVTSFCPTIVTSPKEVYHSITDSVTKKAGGKEGATVLGLHLEGPFINKEKKGAHPIICIKELDKGFETVSDMYGNLSNVAIVTLAPELKHSKEVIQELTKQNITVAVGHSMADLRIGEEAVNNGATLITHLFNAMLPFHHRDPGLVGLLTSDQIPAGKSVYFGIISDGIHTHPAALRIAYRAHPKGLVLVTDAISAMGLEEGKHNIGQLPIEIRNKRAYIAGTNTLCGSIASMIECVHLFKKVTDCTTEFALEAASLHPAEALNISTKKGTLDFNADADFVMLNDDLEVFSTWIAGECVYHA